MTIILIRSILYYIFNSFLLVLAVYCVSSWFIRDPFNKFMRVLNMIVDPILDPVRSILRAIPFIGDLPVDFSPIIVFLLFRFVCGLLI